MDDCISVAVHISRFVALAAYCGNVPFKPGNVRFSGPNQINGIIAHRFVCALVTVRKRAVIERIDNVRNDVPEPAGIPFVDNREEFAALCPAAGSIPLRSQINVVAACVASAL